MRGDHIAVAVAEAFRGDGAILASPMGPMPALGARLARATFEPELLLSDGEATLVDLDGAPVGWMPYRRVFDVVWGGRRHVMMGASQLDQRGNQNISALGPWARPKVQLLGVRGAPGNTVCHPTSYFIDRHSTRVFVPRVDMVCGVGTDRGAFEIRRVVSDLGVFDFSGPGGTMHLVSVHPGVDVEDVFKNTGFDVHVDDVVHTRGPTPEEAEWLDRLDPGRRVRGEAP